MVVCVYQPLPIIEERIDYQDIQGKYTYGNFSIYVGKYFKKGALQDKKRESYNIIVAKMNGIINSVLHTSTVQDAQDDCDMPNPSKTNYHIRKVSMMM